MSFTLFLLITVLMFMSVFTKALDNVREDTSVSEDDPTEPYDTDSNR